MPKVLIIGASGSGTTTIGKKLADKLSIAHIETDDLFWIPTYPPYTKFRNQRELTDMLDTALLSKSDWVLSGSPCGWGDIIISQLSIVIFLIVPTSVRVNRIAAREHLRHGNQILEGGELFQLHNDFLAWTKLYDDGNITGRTRALHEEWLSKLPCPVLRFEGQFDSDFILTGIVNHINS